MFRGFSHMHNFRIVRFLIWLSCLGVAFALLVSMVEAQITRPSGGASPAGLTGAVNFPGATITAFDADSTNFKYVKTVVSAPVAPSLSGAGASGGSTSWGYTLMACTFSAVGNSPCPLGTEEGAAATTAVGKATLDAMNPIVITPPACTGTIVSYSVARKTAAGTPATTGLLGNVACGATFTDDGKAIVGLWTYATPVGYSQGLGMSLPLVNTSMGSAFGCEAVANIDTYFTFNDASTGLLVANRSDCAGFDYLGFLSHLTVVDNHNFLIASEGQIEVPAGVSYSGTLSAISGWTRTSGTTTSASVNRFLNGGYFITEVTDNAISQGLIWNVYSKIDAYPNARMTGDAANFYATQTVMADTYTNLFEFYGTDLSGQAINAYYSWFDSTGVYRCKEDNAFNSVGQSICALYNPQVTKYVPGAVNYERIVEQWQGNVSEIGNYAGGSGTLRMMRLLGGGLHFGTSSNIATTTFTGAGLNDGVFNGTYTGATLTYCAIIDGTGTPDTFKWGTNAGCDNGAATVAITGANQALSSGVVIKFAATTGHTATNKWSVVATAAADLNTLADSTGALYDIPIAPMAKTVVCIGTDGKFYAGTNIATVIACP